MVDHSKHPNAELLERFYAAFGRCHGVAMAACYTPDAQFSDPVFVGLRGAGRTRGVRRRQPGQAGGQPGRRG